MWHAFSSKEKIELFYAIITLKHDFSIPIILRIIGEENAQLL